MSLGRYCGLSSFIVSDKGWLPRIDCLVNLAAMAALVPLSLCAIVFSLRSLLRREFSIGAGASLLVMAFALFASPRLPAKPTQICQISGTNAVVRFYLFESSGGATTSDSYHVTFQDGAIEKTIFSAYSSPGISTIQCQTDAVVLFDFHRDPIVLPLEWIKSDLKRRPLRFYKGILESLEYQEQVRHWDGVMIPTPTPAR